jgi:uncharacterized protein
MFRRKKSNNYFDLNASIINTNVGEIKKRIKSYKSKSDDHKELNNDIKNVVKGKLGIDSITINNGKTILMRIVELYSYLDISYLLDELLPLSTDLNIQDNQKKTLLIYVIENFGKVRSIDTLYAIAGRTNLNTPGDLGFTPLMHSIAKFDKHESHEFVNHLITNSNVDVSNMAGTTAFKLSILHYKKHKNIEIVKRLAEKTTVSFKLENMFQTLNFAINQFTRHYNVEIMEIIIDRCEVTQMIIGALLGFCEDANNGFFFDKTTRMESISNYLELLVQKAKVDGNELNLDSVDENDMTLLGYAIRINSDTLVRLLVELGADVNSHTGAYTPLEWAIFASNVEIVKYLLRRKADPNNGKVRKSCLCTAALWINEKRKTFAAPPEVIRSLLRHGADPNYQDPITGGTCGMLCIIRPDWFDIAKLLVAKGADLTIKDNRGYTMIHYGLVKYMSPNYGVGQTVSNNSVESEGHDDVLEVIGLLINSLQNIKANNEITPKEFANTYFTHPIDTSDIMSATGETIMHIIIRLIIAGRLKPSALLKLKKHGSVICIDHQNDQLQTPIDLIAEAGMYNQIDAALALRLTRELTS